jgi:exodeoxyribonuclease-3
MIAATCGGVRIVSVYAPNGRMVGSPFYEAKLVWYERLLRWLVETARPEDALVIGGDFNVAPADADVWDPRVCHGGTHVSPLEREAFAALGRWGLVDALPAAGISSPAATPGGTTARGNLPPQRRDAHRSPAGDPRAWRSAS